MSPQIFCFRTTQGDHKIPCRHMADAYGCESFAHLQNWGGAAARQCDHMWAVDTACLYPSAAHRPSAGPGAYLVTQHTQAARAECLGADELFESIPICFSCAQDLREQLPASVPMWAIDTACLYPLQLTAKAPAKAYIFRSGTDKPRRERIAQMPYSSGSRNWGNFLASCRVRRTALCYISSKLSYKLTDHCQ